MLSQCARVMYTPTFTLRAGLHQLEQKVPDSCG